AARRLHESPITIPAFDPITAGQLADRATVQLADLPAGWAVQGSGVKFGAELAAATSAGGTARAGQAFVQGADARILESAVLLCPTRQTADCVFGHISEKFTGDAYFTAERDRQIAGLPSVGITSADRGEVVRDPAGIFVPILLRTNRGRTLYDEIVVVRKGNA